MSILAIVPPLAYGWAGRWASCRQCGRTDRPEIDEGLCVECAAERFGEHGLNDMPPAWAGGTESMAMERPRIMALPDVDDGAVAEPWHPQYPDGCTQCGRTTVPHQAGGKCRTCYRGQFRRHAGSPAPSPPVALATPEATPDAVARVPASIAPAPPTLRPRFAERVTIYRFTCPNCDGRLSDTATGRDEFRAIDGGLVLACAAPPGGTGCGARWAIGAASLPGEGA